jgi:hypothetical protein
VLRHSEHSCHPWFAERFFTEGSKGNKEGNLEPFATFVFFCFPPGLEGNHGFGSGKWMQFRFSTEVNEGNKDVSGVLKSPSLPSFPSVFLQGWRGTTDLEAENGCNPDSLQKLTKGTEMFQVSATTNRKPPVTTFFVCRSEGNIPKAGSIVDRPIAEDNNRSVLAI